jgi:sugar phosphate isomerase/epimerase
MKIALSTQLLLNHRLTVASLERIGNVGFPQIEIFCARRHFDYRNHEQVAELGHWFRDSDVKLNSLHSPMHSDDVGGRSGPQSHINLMEPVKARRMASVEEVKRALDVADVIPFRYLIQHLGANEEEIDEERLDAALTSLEELRLYAGQRGVSLILENIPNCYSSAERLNYFLGSTHLKLGYCFDIGHANLTGDLEHEFNCMAERIRSTHIHDNDGVSDLHSFPLEGKGVIDWAAAMKMLASRPDQYPLVLELKDRGEIEQPLETAKRVADKLLALAH